MIFGLSLLINSFFVNDLLEQTTFSIFIMKRSISMRSFKNLASKLQSQSAKGFRK